MALDRRSVLSALGLALPFGLGGRVWGSTPPGPAPAVRLRPFEEAVRQAFWGGEGETLWTPDVVAEPHDCRRVEVGHSDQLLAGIQGCHNDRPFAGFPTSYLRIVRVGAGPGPVCGGVRLYVAMIDIALIGSRKWERPSRPLDFATLPPAPALTDDPVAVAGTPAPATSGDTRGRAKKGRV